MNPKRMKDPLKKQEEDLERKQERTEHEDEGAIEEGKKEPKRFKKVREEEFPKSHRTKG